MNAPSKSFDTMQSRWDNVSGVWFGRSQDGNGAEPRGVGSGVMLMNSPSGYISSLRAIPDT